ncbi:MAG: energy-coupling factor transporter transmembrane component T [Brachybacterium sp.]|nr:energy-coupling factor transporter transmembrane component T [Brachybacterium sp.]
MTTPRAADEPAPGHGVDPAFLERLRRPLTTGNVIRDLNPVNALIILGAIALIAFCLPGILPSALACLLYVLLAVLAGVGRSFLDLYLKLFLVVGLILFALRAIFLDIGEQYWAWGPFVISQGGLAEAARFSLLVMALCGALVLFFRITPMKNLMMALEARGVRSQVTYVVLSSFQAIQDLGRNSRTVMDAQRSRGIETDGGILTRIRSFVPILAPVFLSAMNQTEERALALDARSFNTSSTHTHLTRLQKVPLAETVVTALVVALAVATVLWVIVL